MVKAQRSVGFALNTLTQLAQAVTSKNDSLAIRLEALYFKDLHFQETSGKQFWEKTDYYCYNSQASGQILHEEKLALLADPGIPEGQAIQTVITHNAAYQADDLDAYDSDCDKLNTAKVAYARNLSHYDSCSCEYVIESQQAVVQNSNSFKQQDALILSMIEQLKSQLEPKIYVGDIIEKTNPIVIIDSEETLMLAEESRSKMLLTQKDPIMLEKKVNSTPVDYAIVKFSDTNLSRRPTIVEVPKELPKFSMVNTSLKKLKHYLAGFDVVVKEIIPW
ncbi:hypothetical protein Tco_0392815 [Tanacetum coccineum]